MSLLRLQNLQLSSLPYTMIWNPVKEDGEYYLVSDVQQLPDEFARLVNEGKLTNALALVIHNVQEALAFLTTEEIFRLDRNDLQQRMRADSAIHACYELIRVCAILLQPATPTIAAKCLNRLGIPMESRMLEDARDSFCALDGEKFERVGRLLGPPQGMIFKTSIVAKKEKADVAR